MHFLDWPDTLSITTCSLKLYSNAADKTRISVSLEGELLTTLFSVSWCKISTACSIVLVSVSSWVLSNRSYVFSSMRVSSLHSPSLYNTNSSHLNISKTYSLSFFITSNNSFISLFLFSPHDRNWLNSEGSFDFIHLITIFFYVLRLILSASLIELLKSESATKSIRLKPFGMPDKNCLASRL